MFKLKLNCTPEKFNSQLEWLTTEGSAELYNSPFRALYFLKMFKKKPFLGYIFKNNFRITTNSFVPSFHILIGNLEVTNGYTILSIKTSISKVLLIFLFIWFGLIFGLSLYFAIGAYYVESSILFSFGLFALIMQVIIGFYTKKRDIQLLQTKLDQLVV